MKKIHIVRLFAIFLFCCFLYGCKTEKLEISASITSIHSEQNRISFYATITTNKEVHAKAELESTTTNEKISIDPLVLNETKEYSFEQLISNENYKLSISYTLDYTTYITIAQEYIQTTALKKDPLTIDFKDQEYIYDGEVKSYQIESSYEFAIQYTLNGITIEQPIQVGTYDVDIYFAGNEDYQPTSFQKKLIIKKGQLDIQYKELEYIYDGKAKEINYIANFAVPLTIDYYLNDQKVDSCIDAGTYTAVLSYPGDRNIEQFTESKTFTIQKAVKEFLVEDVTVSYLDFYEVQPLMSEPMEYMIEYYLNGEILSTKPSLPGEYRAIVHINHKNYRGSQICKIKIGKIDYEFDIKKLDFVYGEEIKIEVEDFVHIEYQTITGEPLPTPPSEIGEYRVKLFFTNHEYYKDFSIVASLYIGEKRRILIDIQDNLYEENQSYEIKYASNYDIDLTIEYYEGTVKIEKPTKTGKYKVILSYQEDSNYYAFREETNLILYPKEQTYETVDGIYHITGKVIHQTDTISFIVNGNNILHIKDLTLKVNQSYEIVGEYQDYGTVLLKKEISNVSIEPLEVTMMDFSDNKDFYLMKYIELSGMVLLKNSTLVLKMEENGIEIPLDNSYLSYYVETKGLTLTILLYKNEYIVLSSREAIFTEEEELYASVLLFKFNDIVDCLPETTTAPFEIEIQYISSSNPEVINVTTREVTPKDQDVIVTLKVCFSTSHYQLTKVYNVKVLKKENIDLMIYSIEMRQQYGDSTFIKYGDFDILIDAGDKKDGPYVNQFLKEHISSDNHLDMIIVTHCHSDHMGGLAYASGESSSAVKALDGIATIGTIVDYGHDRSTNALHNSWVSIRNSYIAKGAEYYPVYDCAKNINGAKSHYQIDQKLSLDFIDTMTYALPSDNKGSSELNIYSIASLLTYENFKFFFAGDLEDLGEYNLYNNIANTPLKDITEDNIVLYKAAHHGTDPGGNNGGKNGGNQLPFLKALKPDYFFASAAMCSGNYPTNNSGDKFIGGQPHPYIKCLANFLRFNDNVYFNGTNGTLEFTTDGKELKQIQGFGATTNYLLESGGSPIDYASQANLKLIDTLWYKKNRQTAVNNVLGR